ncbi:DUF222 domain-containing protein [Angustibacter sp. McL0619]|uniref:HNH endonuclease signature motif containing protein n=1 Tax=Angustibacter sp. McL0619 TaxID=3415676 RepID=UPI003CE96D55
MTTDPGSTAADDESAALARAISAVAELAQAESWQLSDAELIASVAGLEHATRVIAAHSTRLLADAGSRGLPAKSGHGRLAHWLREVVPTMSPGQAAGQARRAERLYSTPTAADLAPTRHAMLTGELAADQVDVVSRTVEGLLPPSVPAGTIDAETLHEAQDFLLDQARVFDAPRLHSLASYLTARLDPDADARLARDERARARARALTMVTENSGMVHLTGSLTPECGAALRTALDAWSAPRPAADGTPDPRTPAQRRHDALNLVADTVVATPGLLPETHGSPYRVVVTVAQPTLAATLEGRPVDGLQPATLPDGTALSSEALANLACDADLVPILVDGVGNPLDVGDTQRLFPPRQRTAIAHRDRHCSYPGCQAPPAWCQAHHIVPFGAGGATSVENGTLLCGRHHRHVHATRARAELVDGHVVWNTGPPGDLSPPNHAALTRATQALDALARRWHLRRRE